jgi:20S proteasome subunit alpha 7
MSSIGTGYDYSCTTFSPDGRVFQIEYADKAVEAAPTAIGIRCVDGVVLAVENLVPSKLLEENSNPRIHTLDRHLGCGHTGLIPDARQLVVRGRSESQDYRKKFGSSIPVPHLTNRLTSYVHAHTLYSSIRPFGCAVMIAGYDDDGPHLFLVEPQGISYEYSATAIGKAAAAAKTELEKLNFKELTVESALVEAAKIIHMVHDAAKDKDFRLEMSWICKESNFEHQKVPASKIVQVQEAAQGVLAALDDDEEDDDEN